MTDQNEGGNAGDSGAPDPIAQLKAESNRKLDGLKSEIGELKAATSVLVEALQRTQTKPAAKAEAKEDLSDLLYSDPERYAQIMEERAEARIMGRLSKQQEAQQRTQAVLGELAAEYPEINDMHSPLTKKAVELYNALPDNERNSPISYKLAVKEAAAELGVKPRSKRADTDDFVGGGNARGSDGQRRAKKDTLDPGTRRWAEVLNVELTPEVEARLIERSKRKWSTYQRPLTTKKKGTK